MAANKFMWTTSVPVSRTIGEISAALVKAGARQIATGYGEGGEVSALCFSLVVESSILTFKLPVRSDLLFNRINGSRKRQRAQRAQEDRDQAEKIAWRQAFRWVEAQLAYVETGMVKPHEAFLAYLQAPDGRSLFESMQAGKFKALAQ